MEIFLVKSDTLFANSLCFSEIPFFRFWMQPDLLSALKNRKGFRLAKSAVKEVLKRHFSTISWAFFYQVRTQAIVVMA
ncbi:hypothetical protein [Acinetobacter variabilis]|uniref:hypothetical protein n=1 Tax=Acinetobacter variabilis TaxID=70346 RepID=UPI0021BFD13A|nr:hypothetical protein [Acinetobacter variabilis]UXI52261.1 hypothetical protein N5980_04730 [Acinetobacter variabilis]